MTNQFPISSWRSYLGRLLAVAIVASFVLALIYTADTASAQKKNDADKKQDKDYKKDKAPPPAPGKIVLHGKADHQKLSQTIDQLIDAELKKNEVAASGTCTDEEFIRRAYLDITGVIPTADAVKTFLASKEADKRSKLVEELLQSPRYGRFAAELWAKQLLPRDSVNRKLTEGPMVKWLEERFTANLSWDKIVYDIVTATGPQNENGAVTFFIANAAPEKMTDLATQHFMGVQLQCAQCHNHPFTDYKQSEYWGMAAFFMNVTISANPNQAAKTGNAIAVGENVGGKKGKKLKLPPEAKIVAPAFLQAEQPKLDKAEPYRPVLAKWMTSKTNAYFARAAANKLWFHYFGRGLVNPHDDMHPDNPASHPDLIATMADQLKQNDFDLKYLIRAIVNSKTYQRSSKPAGNNGDDLELFSHALVRNLYPEQLFDSLTLVLGAEPARADAPAKKGNPKNQPAGARQKFIDFFTGDDGYKPLEYQVGIQQALLLMNSKQLGNNTKAVSQAMKLGKTPEQVIDHLFLATVARHANAAEAQKMAAYVQKQANQQQAYGDIVWALLNSSEFGLNH